MPLATDQSLRFGSFAIDGATRALVRDGQRLSLRPKTFAVLEHLVLNAGRLVTKDELLEAVWPRVIVTEDSLTRCISDLRTVLDESGSAGSLSPGAIRTRPRQGYIFEWEVQAAPGASTTPPSAVRSVVTSGWLIGRASEIGRLSGLLRSCEGVSLVGPGGVGKSALAHELLRERRTRDGLDAVWVELAGLPVGAGPEPIAQSLAAALGVPLQAADLVAAVASTLQPLPLLIVFDNAEHVAAGLAVLLPRLRVPDARWRWLVTSQQPLHMEGEQVLRLGALALPPGSCGNDELAGHAASALFLRRAREADADFALEAGDGPMVAEICRRLDGLPLALELAGAQAPWLGVAELARQLHDGGTSLRARRGAAPPRQQSLQAAMAWSHELLPEEDRIVFRRLAAFPGSFTLAMARAMVADDALPPDAVQDALESLVQRSLVQVRHRGGTRLLLLETARTDAARRLAEAGEFDAVMSRLVDDCLTRLGSALRDLYGQPVAMDVWRDDLQHETQAALNAWHWAVRHDPARALMLAVVLAQVVGGEAPQQRRRLIDGTEPFVQPGLAPAIRGAWELEAAIDRAATRTTQALAHARAAVRGFRARGEAVGLYRALSILLYCESAEPQAAAPDGAVLAELRRIEDRNWPPQLRAQGAYAHACWFSARGAYDEAIAWRRRTLELYREAQSTWRGLVAHANLVDSLLAAGRLDEAVTSGRALHTRLLGTRYLAALPASRLNLAGALLRRGEAAEARSLAKEGWAQAVQLGWQPYWADQLAMLAAHEGRQRCSALLLGYADAGYAAASIAREVNEARAADEAFDHAVGALGAHEATALRARGRELGDHDAASLAFAHVDTT